MADSCAPGDETSDAARWWRAYVLAERDEVDQLRELAVADDDHARRQLADWLADRAKADEAVEVIRPLADAGDDVAELRLARWLADLDRGDELRERADRGGYHVRRELAGWLAEHDLLGELRQRADSGDYLALHALVRRLADRDLGQEFRELAEAAAADRRLLILDVAKQAGSSGTEVPRARIDLGDDSARHILARLLARRGELDDLRQRAEGGDESARYWLDEAQNQS